MTLVDRGPAREARSAYTPEIAAVDPRASAFSALVGAVLDAPGALPRERRQALAEGDLSASSPAVAAFLATVDRASYETSDAQTEAAAEELGEEAVFEATIAVALGAARRGLAPALAAVKGG